MKRVRFLLFGAFLSLIILSGCQDLPPDVYDSRVFVEAYLIVDRPIDDVKIMFTQSLSDSFSYENSYIRDADVFIKYNSKKIKLVTDATGERGYYYPDTNVKVLPDTKYELEVILSDGSVLTAETNTPNPFKWIVPPPPTLYYPKDTVDLSDATDTIKISWERNPSALYYFIRISNLDTANYGKYLVPPTADSNRRVYKPFSNPESPSYTRTQSWGFVPLSESPVVWSTFKWYGKHRISIFTPDFNFIRWSLQYFRSGQYDPLLGNINGGIGCFGSASQIDADMFLVWPNP